VGQRNSPSLVGAGGLVQCLMHQLEDGRARRALHSGGVALARFLPMRLQIWRQLERPPVPHRERRIHDCSSGAFCCSQGEIEC
jgi:hypothetical protein